MTESQKPPNSLAFAGLGGDLAVDEIEDVGDDHDDAGRQEVALRQRPSGRDVDQHAGERENIRMNPEPDARGDDEPERDSNTPCRWRQ